MTLPTWAGTFVDGTTSISADFLNNYVKLYSRGIDGTSGGTYTNTAVITFDGAFGLAFSSPISIDATAPVTGTCTWGATTTRTGAEVISGTSATTRYRQLICADPPTSLQLGNQYDTYMFIQPAAQRDIEVMSSSPVPTAGERIWFRRVAAGAFSIILHREGSASAIVTLPGSTASAALLEFNGTNWVGIMTDGGTKGAEWG
jgi:hypothetical protein